MKRETNHTGINSKQCQTDFVSITGLVPSNDLQQAMADMFSEGVFDLENGFVRAFVHPDSDQKVR